MTFCRDLRMVQALPTGSWPGMLWHFATDALQSSGPCKTVLCFPVPPTWLFHVSCTWYFSLLSKLFSTPHKPEYLISLEELISEICSQHFVVMQVSRWYSAYGTKPLLLGNSNAPSLGHPHLQKIPFSRIKAVSLCISIVLPFRSVSSLFFGFWAFMALSFHELLGHMVNIISSSS